MRIVTRMSVSFTGPESAFLHAEAERLGISVADAVRRIIDQHREGRPEKEIAVTSKRHAKAETVENLAAAPARTAQEEPDAAPVQHAPELVEPHQAQRQAERDPVPAPPPDVAQPEPEVALITEASPDPKLPADDPNAETYRREATLFAKSIEAYVERELIPELTHWINTVPREYLVAALREVS